MASNSNRPIFNEINITPLTDIFLVLLIIMMVVAPMLEYPGLKLAIPTVGPDAETKEPPKTQTIAIAANDALFTDDELSQPLALTGLTAQLRTEMAEKTDGLIIAVHPKASHGMMTRVMDTARSLGIDKMAVTALPDDSELSDIPEDYR